MHKKHDLEGRFGSRPLSSDLTPAKAKLFAEALRQLPMLVASPARALVLPC